MEVRIKTAISGTIDGQEWPAVGSVADLDDDLAADLINAGVAAVVENADAVAAEVTAEPKTEKAVAPAGETALTTKNT